MTALICTTHTSQGFCPHDYVLAKTKVKLWESIWPGLSCEVERCIIQDELEPLLPKAVNERCWPPYRWLDSTFFLPQVKAGALANHLPQLCVRCGCIDPCKTHLQNTVGTLQWGAHSMQMQCSGWRTDLRGMDNTTQFKQGRVSVSVTAWPACTVSVYLGRRRKWKTSFKLCQMFREWASCLGWTVRMFLI